eukprot:4713774-Prymnesium_polylepis.1
MNEACAIAKGPSSSSILLFRGATEGLLPPFAALRTPGVRAAVYFALRRGRPPVPGRAWSCGHGGWRAIWGWVGAAV